MKDKIIVMGADSAYTEQASVTIKSICLHNQNIKFYVINKDIEDSWFVQVNHLLQKYDSCIEDIKIKNDEIERFRTFAHISSATYLRYFIPERIKEDKLLYLDSDLIVRGSLDELFQLDLEGCSLAACYDGICDLRGEEPREFNAGVMLIDNRRWKERRVLDSAISLHREQDERLKNADQSVLNILFERDFLELDRKYNYQTGSEFIRKYDRMKAASKRVENPLIVHFTTGNKPWSPIRLGWRGRYRLRNFLSLKEIVMGNIEIEFGNEWKALKRREL